MDTLPELRVPYGCPESGPLVPVAAATRGVRYTCPGCSIALVLRDGPSGKRRKHFAHPSNGACSQESIFHATAKRLIAEVIREHVAGKGNGISLRLNCPDCTAPYSYAIPRDKFTEAAEEYALNGYRCDVVGLSGAEVCLAIEVMHMHATSDDKAAGLLVPMVELEAFDVLADPCLWIPIRHTLKRKRCDRCKARAAAIAAEPPFVPRPRPVRTAPLPMMKPQPKPAAAPSASKPGDVTRRFVRMTTTLGPFGKQLERELEMYLRSGGRGRRRGKPRL